MCGLTMQVSIIFKLFYNTPSNTKQVHYRLLSLYSQYCGFSSKLQLMYIYYFFVIQCLVLKPFPLVKCQSGVMVFSQILQCYSFYITVNSQLLLLFQIVTSISYFMFVFEITASCRQWGLLNRFKIFRNQMIESILLSF